MVAGEASARFLRALALLAISQSLFLVGAAYSYLATDGWYDLEMFAFSMLVLVPFIAFSLWMAVRVRAQAREIEVELPEYRSVLKRVAFFYAWFAACVVVIGVIAAVTTSYGGLIFLAVIVIGAPALTACVFLFSWTSWLFGKSCLQSRRQAQEQV